MRLVRSVEKVITRGVLGSLEVDEKNVEGDHVVEDFGELHNLFDSNE